MKYIYTKFYNALHCNFLKFACYFTYTYPMYICSYVHLIYQDFFDLKFFL